MLFVKGGCLKKRRKKLPTNVISQEELADRLQRTYGRNQSGCEKAKKVGFLASILWVFLTFYIVFALLKINMCFKHLEASHIMSFDS